MIEIWELYKATGDHKHRETLILHYYGLVKVIAGKMAQSFPSSVETEDLVSYGVDGLIDAIDKFDPSLGYKFETYANSRIRGAIIDSMRAMDWVPRSVRAYDREHGVTSGTLLALDEPMHSDKEGGYGDLTMGDSIHDDDWDHDLVDSISKRTAGAAEAIPEREQLVLVLYYYDGLTLAEIGTIFGVTESRICQIHTKALAKLKENFEDEQ
jgi:RNA polymerase sigma factor FliA